MSRYWGPLGWMTLHSISLNYPDHPTLEDKQILVRFLDRFTETISCPSCQSHFKVLYQSYRGIFPDWSSSKFNLFLFISRAHNSVNKRLDKPLIRSVSDCLETIKRNSINTTLAGFRQSYVNYLLGNWGKELSGEGRIKIGLVKELQKINNEYWSLREINLETLNFQESDVLINVEDKTQIQKAINGMPTFKKSLPNVGFRIIGGRLKLGNM